MHTLRNCPNMYKGTSYNSCNEAITVSTLIATNFKICEFISWTPCRNNQTQVEIKKSVSQAYPEIKLYRGRHIILGINSTLNISSQFSPIVLTDIKPSHKFYFGKYLAAQYSALHGTYTQSLNCSLVFFFLRNKRTKKSQKNIMSF